MECRFNNSHLRLLGSLFTSNSTLMEHITRLSFNRDFKRTGFRALNRVEKILHFVTLLYLNDKLINFKDMESLPFVENLDYQI